MIDDPMHLSCVCYCEQHIVSVGRKYIKMGLTLPCSRRECLALAVKSLHKPGGREVLNDRRVKQNFRNAGYDLNSLGLGRV